MPRSDERVTYEVVARNAAPAVAPAPGDSLTCEPKTWTGTPAPTFAYQWYANGLFLGSAHGAQTATYTIQSTDEGKSVQCEVIGTNTNASAVAMSAPVVVAPVPATAPPAPSAPTAASSRPTITGTGAESVERTCVPPTAWTGAPTWTFQWLLNGQEVLGATTNKYKPTGGTGEVLQCEVTGTNAGGAAAGVSNNNNVGTVTTPPSNAVAQTPVITSSDYTSAPVTLELELPQGEEVRIASVTASNWTCTKVNAAGATPAKLACTRSDPLAPETAYPTVTVVAAIGQDAPSPAVARATLSEEGGPSVTTEDVLTFEPAVPFGIAPGSFKTEVLDAEGHDYTQAGGHPFSASTSFAFNTHTIVGSGGKAEPAPIENARDVRVELPPGFIGNPEALPQRCENAFDVLKNKPSSPLCPAGSIVGGGTIQLRGANETIGTFTPTIYAIEPEVGTPAQFAFEIGGVWLYTLTASLRPAEGYAISIEAPQTTEAPELVGASVTLCGFGAKTGGFLEVTFEGCRAAGEVGANTKPFLTNLTECSPIHPVTKLGVDSWQHPELEKVFEAESPLVTGCATVPFEPEVSFSPTSRAADSPTGLSTHIGFLTEGLEKPTGTAQGDLKRAIVTLPSGMAVNPSAANGLAACSSAQIKLGTNDPVECPEASNIGSAEIKTPLLEQPLKGKVYLAKQGDNPFGSLLALYLVAESTERGILVKIPGKVTPDPSTGQLTATFDNNPQLPFSSLELRFNEGNQAPLLNPPTCGNYGIEANLSPWSAANPDAPTPAEARSTTSTFQINEGPGGGSCPSGKLEPTLNAGLSNPIAGTTSPFVLSLTRADGSQRFKGLDLTLPPGVTAYLKGVPYCPDSALASISEAEGTGQGQINSPACPPASQIGTVSVGVGGGSNPYYVNTGKAYLAGPYKGAPLSIAIVTPAVAGPFDLGTVVVRSAAFVNPETAQITVKSDPIPTILHGIPLDVRDIRVSIDRPSFMLAPTSCKESSVAAQVSGESGGSASVSNRFQVADCAALPFNPKLALRVFGKTNRNAKPRLRAVLQAAPGEANIARAQVNLPHSEFLEQNHIKTVCTRVQWAEGNGNGSACPKGSVYGKAKAWTPLLDQPLEGLVYLRSNGGERKLPDLVAALNGQVNIALWGKVDSGPNHGIRNTFEVVPDAPVSKFILEMQGGAKGLLVNSENLCAKTAKRDAIVRFTGQNGAVESFKPKVANSCKKQAKTKKKSQKRSSPRRAR